MKEVKPNLIQGEYDGQGKHFAIVASRFNDFIVARLIDGAMDCLTRHGVSADSVTIYRVPGAWEIPALTRQVVKTGKFDGVIALGAVIRGETPHFDYVAGEVSKGLANIGIESAIPVVYGILTTDTVDQAVDRAGTKQGNRGWESAMTALELCNLYKKL